MLKDFLKMKAEGMDPKALKNRTVFLPKCQGIKLRFLYLSGRREYNQGGAVAIPVSEMLAYMVALGIGDPLERETFMHYMAEMDNVFIDHVGKQLASKTKAS